MSQRYRLPLVALSLYSLLPCPAALGQTGDEDPRPAALASWIALDAPTGHELLATGPLSRAFDGWQVDRNGNMLKTVGRGSPHRVVACGLDSPALAVTEIRDDGYLRLHRIGRGSPHALWDQAHEGQQVRILTEAGPVVGVVAIANGHFAAQHRKERDVVTADDLWLDVGATSRGDVEEMGIVLLDPVLRHIPAWSFGRTVAGPNAGARAGCAAVVDAAEVNRVGVGSTTFVLSTQQVFGWVGLGGALNRLPSVDEVVLVGPGEEVRRDETVSPALLSRLAPVMESKGVRSLRRLAPRVRHPGAVMETLALSEAFALHSAVYDAADVRPGRRQGWPVAPTPQEPLNSRISQANSDPRITRVHDLLDRLAETPGVPEHEGPVRSHVLDALPEWARNRAEVDLLGNLWVAMGPARDTVVFMAHLDEVGWTIETIEPDGTVTLRRRGGVISSAWEGQPARLQLDPGSGAESGSTVTELNGVFSTRDDPAEKRPETVTAWFGYDRPGLLALGAREGMGVTGYKEGHRMGRYRYTARSLDDRAGSTALALALHDLDPDVLDHTVIVAWSVQEEGGLVGAGAMAERFAATTRRIYSVDTFVSSDTPLESTHFAHAPLGQGPVLRSIENSGMATRAEKDRNQEIARRAGVRAQVGLTQGGTDGTMFTFWGAPNSGLSWPGRYSHSPAEVLDLRDLADLVDLAVAMMVAKPLP